MKMTGLYWFFSPIRIANGETRVAKRLQVIYSRHSRPFETQRVKSMPIGAPPDS